MTGLSKALRAVAGVVILVVLVVTVNSWMGQYKAASAKRASAEASSTATGTVDATATTMVRGATFVVVSDVMIRATPDAAAKPVRKAKKGDRLFVVGSAPQNWLQVKDTKGRLGYLIKDAHLTVAK